MQNNNRQPYQGSRGNYRNNNRRGSGHRGYKPSKIDPRKYVAKAQASSDCTIYDATCRFDDFDLSSVIRANIKRKNFTQPTKIQAQTIPSSLAGKDILGLASTGSGKTAAFLIPMINKSLDDRDQRCLIVTPTRELADQIQKELHCFSQGSNIRSVLVIGGANIGKQINGLRKNPQFVIATPGRLKDLEQRREIDLRQFNNIVLDEVDRMLDMGFVNDMDKIISKFPKERQSLFFAATLNENVKGVMRKFVNNPTMISVKTSDNRDNIKQDIVEIKGRYKPGVLRDLLRSEGVSKALIFMRTKRSANNLHQKLLENGFRSAVMHGNKSQNQRRRALEQFRQGKVSVLIATDVAARGLDINDISHVINYDLPESYEVYIHRIGRTGRVNKKGTAITFIS